MAVRAADRGPALAGSGKRLRPKSPPQGRSSETETAGIFRSLLRPNRTGPPAVPQSLSALLLQAVAPAGRPRYGTKYVVRPAGMDRALCRRGNRTDGSDEMSGFHGLGTQQAENARIAQSNARLRTGPLSGSRGRGKYGRGETLGSKRRTPLSIRPNGSAIRPQPFSVRKSGNTIKPRNRFCTEIRIVRAGYTVKRAAGYASGTVSVRQNGQIQTSRIDATTLPVMRTVRKAICRSPLFV